MHIRLRYRSALAACNHLWIMYHRMYTCRPRTSRKEEPRTMHLILTPLLNTGPCLASNNCLLRSYLHVGADSRVSFQAIARAHADAESCPTPRLTVHSNPVCLCLAYSRHVSGWGPGGVAIPAPKLAAQSKPSVTQCYQDVAEWLRAVPMVTNLQDSLPGQVSISDHRLAIFHTFAL